MTCKVCGADQGIVLVGFPGVPVCRDCLKKHKKKAKKRNDAARYYEALTRPDLRGLRGVRK